MDTAINLQTLLVGGASGLGVVGFFALLFRLLFAREKSEYARLDARIIMLESALKTEQAGHMDCVHNLGVLEGKVTQLSTDLDLSIRRHDLKTEAHIDSLRKENERLAAHLRANGIDLPPPEPEQPPA